MRNCEKCGGELNGLEILCSNCGNHVERQVKGLQQEENKRLQDADSLNTTTDNMKNSSKKANNRWKKDGNGLLRGLAFFVTACACVAVPMFIHNQIMIHKYKLNSVELEQYIYAINQYDQAINEIDEINSNATDVSLDYLSWGYYGQEYLSDSTYRWEKANLFAKIDDLRGQGDLFPDKYKELYLLLAIATKECYEELFLVCEAPYSSTSAQEKFQEYDELKEIRTRLDKDIRNQNYVPKLDVETKELLMRLDSITSIKTGNEKTEYETLYYTDGNIRYEGETINGIPNGDGKMYYPQSDGGGVFFDGYFEDGRRTHSGLLYDQAGNIVID